MRNRGGAGFGGPIVEVLDIAKTYPGATGVRALDGVSVAFAAGSFCAVMGPSGSGKSTLLHCAAGLDRPDSGRVLLAGTEIGGLREPRLTEARRRRVGFVFQSCNLIDSLSVWQNVLLPQRPPGPTGWSSSPTAGWWPNWPAPPRSRWRRR